MKTEIESAIKKLAARLDTEAGSIKPDDAMKLAQAALSFGHVLSILHHNETNK